MTQVQTMTNPELNRALAELMGYTVEVYETFSRLYYNGRDSGWLPGAETAWNQIPDYAGNPAASLEVQTAACEVHGELYIWNLAIVQGWVGGTIISRKESVRIATATNRERAEAAYITLSQSNTAPGSA